MILKKLVQTTYTLYSNVLKQVLIFCGFGAIQNARHSQSGIFDHATNYAKKWQTMEWLRRNCFVHLAAYANRVMSNEAGKIRNHIFNYSPYSFLHIDTNALTSYIDK